MLEIDDEREHYLASKRATLQYEGRGPLRLREPSSHAAIERAEAFLRRELAAGPVQRDPKHWATLELDALMLEIQEDLVLMHRPVGFAPERARAHYLHVCFPSHWPPSRMLGKNFLSLHARVPTEASFARSERARHAAKLFEAPAVRFIWSLTPDARLDHHPDHARTLWT
ncbi:MAG TPA: heme-dependent oxidative N-demethylase subunit alpha family protein, partial [Polyangiales bacterium]|nr:heme-dependent oxidative N-demethylase subunit alpha family protein [Polyangiales bacterium]